MIFASDNWAGVHPDIARRVFDRTSEFSPAYGNAELDKSVIGQFCELFEREVSVFLVGTGSIANSLALSAVARPGGVVFCHCGAHIATDECGAPEFFSGGGRLQPVEGVHGKMDVDELIKTIGKYPRDFIHNGQPAAISMTQLSEAGTVYSIEETRQISEIAKKNGMPLHMDGARFANAVAAMGASPAEMSWKSGVDILSFGGTKNGCWCAEAVVFFEPNMAQDFAFIHKRAGQLYSKTCFFSAQFEAYLDEGKWLELAGHANKMASRLAVHIEASSKLRLAWQPDANEVFAIMAAEVMEELKAAGAVFFGKALPGSHGNPVKSGEILARFVCSFATTSGEVDQFGDLIR